jgi:hypothetical protein
MFWIFKLSFDKKIFDIFWQLCPKVGQNYNQFSGHTDAE